MTRHLPQGQIGGTQTIIECWRMHKAMQGGPQPLLPCLNQPTQAPSFSAFLPLCHHIASATHTCMHACRTPAEGPPRRFCRRAGGVSSEPAWSMIHIQHVVGCKVVSPPTVPPCIPARLPCPVWTERSKMPSWVLWYYCSCVHGPVQGGVQRRAWITNGLRIRGALMRRCKHSSSKAATWR